MSKLWGGRFAGELDREVLEYTSSLAIDQRLWAADIQGCLAHARMLGATGILDAATSARIVGGLELVRARFEAGQVTLSPNAEDIHSEIERLLREAIGPDAGRLHTARSRNDQVATATRLYLRDEVDALLAELHALASWLASTAERNLDTILPGTTHLQHAQPVSLAHHLLAYFWMFQRDSARFTELRRRVNQLPLGSAALAGTSFPIDRQQVARELGFEGVCPNSLDAVSDRDFVVEFLSSGALVMTHLSRLAEELILWSTPEYGYVELDDSVTTGSSIMPQKKNPDVAELIRGRVGRLNGALIGALTMLKGLPLAYNRDLQEDKTHLFAGVDTLRASLRMMRRMLERTSYKPDRMAAALRGDFSNATDLADYLVRQGVAFRDAHEITGRAVRLCLESRRELPELSDAELASLSPGLQPAVRRALTPRAVLEARTSEGGTAPATVRRQLELARAWLAGRR